MGGSEGRRTCDEFEWHGDSLLVVRHLGGIVQLPGVPGVGFWLYREVCIAVLRSTERKPDTKEL